MTFGLYDQNDTGFSDSIILMRVIALVSTLLDNVKISMIGSSTCNHNHYRENNSDKNRRHEMTKNNITVTKIEEMK